MKPRPKQQGIALVIALTTIAILSVLITDMHESTTTSYAIAAGQRDRIVAEYMAKSGLNLTRLLVSQEPVIRQAVQPVYQLLLGRPPHQIPVWRFANDVLKPFCNYEEALETASQAGVELAEAGLGGTNATCEIVAFAENSKINVNDPLLRDGDQARRSISMQLFAMMGGYQSPSPYDPIFEQPDADGNTTSRLDVVSSLVDWWDYDNERTVFDPGAGTVSSSGPEDNGYARLADPYDVKNAPFDSIEELRLVRGVGDDFWATFVEPNPDDPDSRVITIYGSGSVNPNEAQPEVLLARLCSYLEGQSLCTDPTEAAKFIQLVHTVRSLIPVPFFTRSSDFLNFVQGRGGERDLFPMLKSFLGEEHPLLFTPITIPREKMVEIDRSFVTAAQILTIQATGFAGRGEVRIRSVVNFHDRWAPPPRMRGECPLLVSSTTTASTDPMPRILGLDIDDRSLRGVLVRTALRRIDVLQYVEAPLAIPRGGEGRSDALREGVRLLRSHLVQPPDQVVTAMDGREASLRTVQLPTAAAKRAAEVLPFELEAVLPFDPTEAVIDYQPVRQTDGQAQLIAAAAPSARVESYLADLREAQLDPREVAVGAAALDGLVPLLAVLGENSPVLLLDVRTEVTDACVLVNGRCVFSRTLSRGIRHAESGDLATAVRRTLTSYRAQQGEALAEAYLMGDASQQPEAFTWFRNLLGIEVHGVPLPPAPGADEGAALGKFGRAAALACRSGARAKRLNLRQGAFAPSHTSGAIRRHARLLSVCAAVIFLSFMFATVVRWVVLGNENEALVTELADVTEEAFGTPTRSLTRAQRLLTGGELGDDPLPRFDAYDVLAAISDGIPEEIGHTTRRLHIELDEDGHGGRFELQGIVASVAERDTIVEKLLAHECVKEIENGRTRPGAGDSGLNYQIDGAVRCPGAPEPEKKRRRGRR